MTDWKSTKFKGVRYREHPTRKRGINSDKYFAIRYQRDGKRTEEGLGWASEIDPKDQKHWTAEKAALVLADLKGAAKGLEAGPTRLAERRAIAQAKKEASDAEMKRLELENVTFGQFFEKTYQPISERSKKPETTRKEKEHFENWIKPIIGNKPLKDVKPFAIEQIKKNVLDAKKSPRTLEYILATIRQIWNLARRDGYVQEDSPTKNVKIPRIDNRRQRFLSPNEAKKLLEHLEVRDEKVYRMATVSLFAGLRAGEIFGLKWGHIDTERGIIHVVDPKGVKNRVAYMPAKLKEIFNRKPEVSQHDGFVFPGKDGNKIEDTPRSFFAAVKALGFNKGMPDSRMRVCFHTLRHTFASWHVAAGTDLYTLKELLGHSVMAMTERYAHLGMNAMQNATRNIEGLLEQSGEAGEVSATTVE
ncbi:MAG: site-specific integrase [Deltaproteobacteria bacterium]|nr:site-specific integrase [Deltaproteobacteria bacterium]